MKLWEKVIPKPRSNFIQVKCPECGNEQITFSHATTIVRCSICGSVLAEPSGGKAKIKGEIISRFE
ncbi:MAG: 30S ribosomal protein S27e [Candidatus Bathyarchaeia archaeon]